MVAVKRRFSPDTQENQLLKAFLRKLSALLILRKERLTQAGLRHQDRATDLISRISFWKTSDTADAIGQYADGAALAAASVGRAGSLMSAGGAPVKQPAEKPRNRRRRTGKAPPG